MSRAGERIDWIERRIVNPQTRQLIKLEPFQTQFIEGLYAEHVQEAGFSLPRKNGKTGLLASLGLAELDLNIDADVVLGATKVKQASRPSGIFGVMKTYIRANDSYFSDHIKVSRNNNDPTIKNTDTGCQAEAVSIWDEDAAQGLNPSLAIMDEFGTEFWTPLRWGSVAMSMGARPGARIVGISTPASQRSAMFDLRTKVLDGTADPSLYWQEHTAPLEVDPYDPATWHMANPALGAFLDIKSLQKDANNLPEHLFRLFRLAQWVDTVAMDGWLGIEGPTKWDALARDIELDDQEDTYLGVDKSAYDDCSAVVILQRHGDMWLSKARIFMPNPTIDHGAIKDFIRETCKTYKVRGIGFDDRYFVEGAQELEKEGLPLIKVPQTPARLVPAYASLYKAIHDGTFLHEDDPEYRLHMLGAVPVMQTSGGFTLAKSRSRTKIDAAVATGIAMSVALDPPARAQTFSWLIK